MQQYRRVDRSIVFNHDRALIAILHMNGNTIKVIAILLEHEPINSIFHRGIHRKNNLLLPSFYGDSHFESLTDAILPGDESLPIGRLLIA